MKCTLIRFTDSKYVESYKDGDLWLSSLSSFWDLRKGRIDLDKLKKNQISEEEIGTAIEYEVARQQDFSEGAAMQVKRDVLDKIKDVNPIMVIVLKTPFAM